VTIDDVEYSAVAKAAKEYGLETRRLVWRLNQGWTPEEAAGLQERKHPNTGPRKGSPIVVSGKVFDSITAAARAYGKPHVFLAERIRKGMTPEQALGLEPYPDWFVPGKGQAARARGERRRAEETLRGLRRCSRCKQEKPFSSFSRARDSVLSYRCKDCTALALIKLRYGITSNEFHALRLQQSGKCAICECDLGLGEQSVSRKQTVAVDHCHETGKVRGLLCNCCNAGLGSFRDKISSLQRAISYLEKSTLR